MIPPLESAVHQSIGFLVRGDMLQRDVMQTMLQKLSSDVSRAHIAESMRVAESQAASSSDRALVGGVPESKVVPRIAAASKIQDKTVEQQFQSAPFFLSEQNREPSSDATQVDDELSLAILESVREMLPELGDAGLCHSLFLCLVNGRKDRVGLWGQEVLALFVPLDGTLGQHRVLYAYGFSRGFDAFGVKGVHGESQDLLSSLPELHLEEASDNSLISAVKIKEYKSELFGRGYSLGKTIGAPADHYVFRLDQVA